MEQIRAFIAVDLSIGVREALSRTLQELLGISPRSLRWVKPNNIHLTLIFLGSISTGSVVPVCRAMSRCAISIDPFELVTKGIGTFPSSNTPRVIWLGLGGAVDELQSLQKLLENSMVDFGYVREKRQFNPHLTLGRMADGASAHGRRKIWDSLAKIPIETGMKVSVRSISLMQSTLNSSGVVYKRLFYAYLGGVS